MSVSNYGETALLNAVPEKPYVKLHTGDPGENGTANAATEATRKQITLAAASGDTRKSSTSADWDGVAATEEVKWVTLWDHPTAGNCWWVIQLEAAKALTAGEDFSIAAGDLSLSLD